MRPREGWVGAALLAGGAYLLIGRVSAAPTDHVQAWRLAAWTFSGVVYAAHIAYEHFRMRSAPRASAFHVAMAVALGAFALAVAGMIHSVTISSPRWSTWLLALVLWPAITAVPAFLGALVATVLLHRLSQTAHAR